MLNKNRSGAERQSPTPLLVHGVFLNFYVERIVNINCKLHWAILFSGNMDTDVYLLRGQVLGVGHSRSGMESTSEQ